MCALLMYCKNAKGKLFTTVKTSQHFSNKIENRLINNSIFKFSELKYFNGVPVTMSVLGFFYSG